MDKHKDDRAVADKLFSDLKNTSSQKFIKHLENIYKIAFKKTRDSNKAEAITHFIAENGGRNQIGVLNSDKSNKTSIDVTKFSEEPSTLFTISIGGNVISRGLTFNNLLSMFFTRGVETLMQQDTYIQRARMFGNRGNEIRHFELTIPKSIYQQWYNCFLLHRLSYQSAKVGQHPVWLEGAGTRSVAPASVDRAHVRVDKGTMSFEKVPYKEVIQGILEVRSSMPTKVGHKDLLNDLYKAMGDSFLPKHVIDFIETESAKDDYAVAIHNSREVEDFSDGEVDTIYRARSFFGGNDFKAYPLAKHHFRVVKNRKGFCRLIYRFSHGKISFLKNKRIPDLTNLK